MTIASWRTATLVLAAICAYQLWHGSTSATPAVAELRLADCPASTRSALPPRPAERADHDAGPARSMFGVKLPTWLTHLTRQPGESLRDYRDRVLPLAQVAIAPQRARIARARDQLTSLGPHQRAELDGALHEAATAIEARVMKGLASGELAPASFQPMTGVVVARELLDIVDHGNTRFQDSLTPDQRAQLASQHFDFADTLLFSTPWEDALHVLDR